jgi:murein DD-endopeptidase MepM/ murein hydrolase activator NlpD
LPAKKSLRAPAKKTRTSAGSSATSLLKRQPHASIVLTAFVAIFVVVGIYVYQQTFAANSAITAYTNPFRSAHIISRQRIDQGVDLDGTGPVYAIGPGKIVENIPPASSGWDDGWFIVEQLSTGRAVGKYVYVAEDCTSNVKDGELVKMATKVCTMFNGSTGIETGWAQAPSHGDIAMAHSEYTHEGLATPFGRNYSQFLGAIGGPTGDISKSSGVSSASLPAGWPTW